MRSAWTLKIAFLGCAGFPISALAQVPDLVTAFDAGGRALGAGSSLYQTSADSLSAVMNPAGLGYLDRGSFMMTGRNLSTTDTSVTGSLDDLRLDSKSEKGDLSIGHIGVAMPLRSGIGGGGAWSLAWTVAGWMHDTQSGVNLANGIATYDDFTRLKTDFVSLGYGRASANGGFSWGFNVIYALQNVKNEQEITFTDPNIPPQIADSDDSGSGVGATFGVMFIPPGKSNVTFGFSARSPIRINKDDDALSLYNKIPGRIAGGIAVAEDGMRGGKDSIVYGAYVEYFYGGDSSPRVDRTSQAAAGIGLEYMYQWGDAVLPIRIGYRSVQKGGDGFDSRSGFTYGFGYRPNNSNWSFELNFGNPQGGGKDLGLGFIYRFGK